MFFLRVIDVTIQRSNKVAVNAYYLYATVASAFLPAYVHYPPITLLIAAVVIKAKIALSSNGFGL